MSMDALLALITWAVIALLWLQYQKCRREGRPFFRVPSKRRKRRSIKVSSPQRLQQKYGQRSDNTSRSQRFKNRPQQNDAPPINAARQRFNSDNASRSPRPKNQPQPIDTSPPQRSQQKHSQRSDNTFRSQRPKNQPQQKPAAPINTVNSGSKETVSAHLVKKLDSLTHNRGITKRLIQNTKNKNPNRSRDWCADRAIWEIERDRR